MKYVSIKNKDSYEYKMIEELTNDCFIQAKKKDNEIEYDLGETKKITEYYNKLSEKDVKHIMNSIYKMLKTLENYLISENSIDMEDVRVDKNGIIKFIIIPDQKSDFSYELSKFLIRMLRYVNAEDKKALELAYNLFLKSSKDGYTINDLMEVA